MVTRPPHALRLVMRPLQLFLRLEAASGILLLVAAVAALLWANLHSRSYETVFIHLHSVRAGDLAMSFSLRALINDGLMAIFFFVVGMEVKRELAIGELSTTRKAALPAIAAVGGMVVPVAIFIAFNWGRPSARGWAIPMATDIAFCIGVLALLRDRVPRGLVVFITALAIFDDIGGILVIALFYGHGLSAAWLLVALCVAGMLVALNRKNVGSGSAYALVGVCLWYALHHAGIHAAIAGVIVGLAVPTRSRRDARDVLDQLGGDLGQIANRSSNEEVQRAAIRTLRSSLQELQSPLDRLQDRLHPLVAFGVMPLFALANAGVSIRHSAMAALASPVAMGVAAGLFVGKPVGIFTATAVSVRLRLAPAPGHGSLTKLLGISIVGGIGFTVALFIAALAFEDDPHTLDEAKLGILIGSIAAGVTGLFVLRIGSEATQQQSQRRMSSNEGFRAGRS